MQVPKLLEWLNVDLELINNGIFSQWKVKIGLLSVDVEHFLGQILQSLLDCFDFGDVVFGFLGLVVVLELEHVVLNVIELFLELLYLLEKTVLDVGSLTLELVLTLVNNLDDAIDPDVGLSEWFHLVLLDLESWVVAEKHEPGNKIMICIQESLLFTGLNFLKLFLESNEKLGGSSLDG